MLKPRLLCLAAQKSGDVQHIGGIQEIGPRGRAASYAVEALLVFGASSVSQEFSERRIQSGSASPSSSFSNTGDNVNACPTTQQVVNTGNVANEQGVTQFESKSDDIDLTDSSITITSDQTATCDQTLNQAAAAGK